MKPRKPSQRLRGMYDHLVSQFGPQQWWPAETAFEVVIGAYLTQNTSWRGVELSIANLRQGGILSIEGIREVSEEKLRALIRPSGFMLRKATALKTFVTMLDTNYSGSLERLAAEPTAAARDRLLALPGVGPETADAILLYALGHPVIVVDEYLRRITTRHQLLPENAKYAEIHQLAVYAFADEKPESLPEHYNEFHALAVMIGKTHCGPKPKCEGCPLSDFYPRPDDM